MNDRELLEAAAKADGIDLYAVWGPFGHFEGYRAGSLDGDAWNPLTDDGDALRLAVALNIGAGNPGMRLSIDWQAGTDPYAATRRAIVRAAAALAVSAQSPPAAP